MTPKYAVEATSLDSLLGEDSIRFEIPAFQRSYAWGNDEVTKLLDDLFEDLEWGRTQDDVAPYFLGSLVLTEVDDATIVLDGQQRLTTVSLLLAVLRFRLEQLGFRRRDIDNITRHLEAGRFGEREAPKIQLQQADQAAYCRLITEPADARSCDLWKSSIAAATRRIQDVLPGYAEQAAQYGVAEQDAYAQMVSKLLYGVEFVRIVAPSESDAFRLFETLNDRGLPLTAADLIKNKLFYRSQTRIKDASASWHAVVDTVGNDEIVNFLRYFWIAFHGDVRKRNLYSVYDEHLETMDADEVGDFASELERVAASYCHIAHPMPESCPWGPGAAVRLSRLMAFGARSCRPVLLACAGHAPDQLEDVAGLCEAVTVRYSIVGELNPNLLERAYGQLATKIRREGEGLDLSRLPDLFRHVPGDDQFRESFATAEAGSRRRAWREILVALNELDSTGETLVDGPQRVHVEHVLPQTPSGPALEEAGLSPVEAAELTNRVGNLTLLSGQLNREISNGPYSEKRLAFGGSEVALNRWFSRRDAWGRDEIEERSFDLADGAVRMWTIGTSTSPTSAAAPPRQDRQRSLHLD